MLTIHQFCDKNTGEPLAGFSVRNRIGKSIAVGAACLDSSRSFVQMSAKRYANDAPLVDKIARLTGLIPRK
jgi:hypothetical protein